MTRNAIRKRLKKALTTAAKKYKNNNFLQIHIETSERLNKQEKTNLFPMKGNNENTDASNDTEIKRKCSCDDNTSTKSNRNKIRREKSPSSSIPSESLCGNESNENDDQERNQRKKQDKKFHQDHQHELVEAHDERNEGERNKRDENPNINDEMKKTLNEILTEGNTKKPNVIRYDILPDKIVGKGPSKTRQPRNEELNALIEAGYRPQNLTIYHHAIVHGIDYRSLKKDRDKETKFCNVFVYYGDDKYGSVVKIVNFTHHERAKWGFLIEHLETTATVFYTNHIHLVQATRNMKFIDIDSMAPIPAIMLTRNNNTLCFTRVANMNETD